MSRVHSHAAAALINFCEGVGCDTLVPYLDPIVERLLKLLNPPGEAAKTVRRYVQEQAITTLAMVADASEATFAKVCMSTCLASFYKFDVLCDNNSTTRR
jgi:importin-5